MPKRVRLRCGMHGAEGRRNAPALINRGYGRLFFWDGRAESLERQALEPILNPIELGLTEAELERRTGMKVADVTAALASREESLTSHARAVNEFAPAQHYGAYWCHGSERKACSAKHNASNESS